MSRERNLSLLRLHRIFREIQRRNRFINTIPSTGLSLLETTILIELQAKPQRTITDFSDLFYLDKPSLSRSIASLKREKYLSISSSETDARQKILKLTPKAVRAIELSDELFNSRMEQYSQCVTKGELDEITKFYKKIADGYHHPAGAVRAGEALYRIEQRRITRCFQLLTYRAFGTEFSSLQYQILSELSNQTMTAQQVGFRLSSKQNTISQNLKLLQEQGLIDRKLDPKDKRSSVLLLTGKGRKSFEDAEKQAVLLLGGALKESSDEYLEKMAHLLEKFAYGRFSPTSNWKVRECETDELKALFRSFFITELVHQGRANECPDEIASKNAYCFLLEKGEAIEGAIQLFMEGDKVITRGCVIRQSSQAAPLYSEFKAKVRTLIELKFSTELTI